MSAPEQQPGGYSTRRLVQFGRSLRAINAQQLSDVALAITTIDISRREDFYYALRALLVRSPDDFALFDQLFELFWLGRAGLLAEMEATEWVGAGVDLVSADGVNTARA